MLLQLARLSEANRAFGCFQPVWHTDGNPACKMRAAWLAVGDQQGHWQPAGLLVGNAIEIQQGHWQSAGLLGTSRAVTKAELSATSKAIAISRAIDNQQGFLQQAGLLATSRAIRYQQVTSGMAAKQGKLQPAKLCTTVKRGCMAPAEP